MNNSNGNNSMMRDATMKDPMMKDSMMKDAMTKDPMMKDAMMKDPMMKDNMMRDPMMRDTMMRETMMRGTQDDCYTMMRGFKGKVAIVAGGAGCIGSAICMMIARQGANVVVADMDEAQASKVAAELPTENGSKHMAMKMDITNMNDMQNAMETIQKMYGMTPQFAVNSAGYMEGQSYIVDMKEQDWDNSMAYNFKGTFCMMQTVAKCMMNAKVPGAMVNVCSARSMMCNDEQTANVSAAAAGAKKFAHCAANEWARFGIRVNCVMTGSMDNPDMESMKGTEEWRKFEETSPYNRAGRPEDVAEAVTFLLSDNASYISGTDIVVCGKPVGE